MAPLRFNVKEHVLPCQYIREYPGATLDNQEDVLNLHIKQYKPKDQSHHRPGAVTIIGSPANAFPKASLVVELYEPFWDEIYQAFKDRGQAIRSIWTADVATQGMSGEINEKKLGNDPSWSDHPRDLLHMINHFREEMPRPLVGIGHSMGGNHLTNLSYIHPRLFTSLILIDPVIHNASAPTSYKADNLAARSSTFRRDRWPSRAVAAASFKKSKFYQSWDPRVLDLWIQFGLRRLPNSVYPQGSNESNGSEEEGPVTLATNKHQEVFMFLRPNFTGLDANGNKVVNRQTHPDLDLSTTETYPFYRPEPPAVFKNLPHLRPSVLYIFGGKSDISVPDQRKQKMDRTGTGVSGSGGVREGRVKEVVFEEIGHLIPMEAPKESAVASAEFLVGDLQRWAKEEREWKTKWASKDPRERFTISDEWKKNIGGDPRGKPLQKL